jgi:hypothetical protein
MDEHPSALTDRMHPSRQRWWIAAGLAGVLAAATAGCWLLFREADPPVEVLPDGTVVRLYGVTYGKRHRMTSGTIGQRMAGWILPRNLARRWSIPVIDHVTTNDSLVVWLEVDSRAVRNKLLYAGPTVAIGDEHGSEFLSSARTSSRTTPNGFIGGYEMPILPPGHDNLAVMVRQSSPDGEARVRFPLRRTFAEKRGTTGIRRVSATSRVDNLEFVVGSLESFPTSASMMYPMTRADCLILEDGQPTTHWTVRALDVLDDAGQAYRMTANQDRYGRVNLNVGLSTNEIWRLRFFLGRTAGFGSEDLVTITGVPLTVSDRATFRPLTNEVNGVNLVLYDVAGFGLVKLSAFLVPGDLSFNTVLVRGVDDKDRNLLASPRSPGFEIKTAPDSKTADLTFAVTRLKSVEVFVKPTAATNVASIFLPRRK